MEKSGKRGVLFVFLLVLIFVSMSGIVSAFVRINEIMYAPSASQGDDSYNEWIEIFNNGTSSVDLNNWTLCGKNLLKGYVNRSGDTNLNTTFALNASKFALITDGGSGTEAYANFSVGSDALALHVDAASLCSGTQLSASGDTLNLSNGTYTQLVSYTSFISLANGNNKTLIFYKGNWTESALENGTPGATNDQFAPDFNKWINPSTSNSFIKDLSNITVNITDVTNVSFALINFNNTNYTMLQNNDLWYYLWNTTKNLDRGYNITIFFNDTLGFSNTDTVFNITIDNTNPKIHTPATTANSRNFISKNSVFNATVNATDSNLLNVTCTLSGTTAGNFSVNGDIHKCSLTAPSTENDYTITFTAIDKANNTNTTTINFTTKYSTAANLTTYDITVSGLNQSNKIVEVTAAFNNKGSNIIYSPNIILSGFESNFAVPTTTGNKTCAANLTAGQSCSSTFNITIFGGTAAGGIEGYTILWKANWTDNSFTSNKLIESAPSIVTINSNPQITVTENMTATIGHNTSQTLNILLNSTGNADLQNANIAFTPSTLMQSWVTISPSSFSSITAGLNKSFNVTVVVPKYTSPGNYTGTLTISATSAESKSILLKIEIPEDSSWTSYPSNITAFKKTNSAGLLGTIYINNTGNIGHRFDFSAAGNLREDIWNDSNPTSQYVEAGRTELVNFNYKKALAISNTYTAALTITSFNKSTANYTYFSLTRDDNNPNLNITAPLDNSFVNGTVKFNVTASDLNLSTIKFYINDNLVLDDISLTKTFKWNTTNGSYPDDIYALKAIAYDGAGNFNISGINITINNTNDNPILKANISAISVIEDNDSAILNLSLYFKSIDGDSLRYNFTKPANITVHANNDTQIANFTPSANFFGLNYIVFTAIDASNQTASSNNITISVANVNDVATVPAPISPPNNTNISSAAGKAVLAWSSSTDADNDPITYYVFLSGNSSSIALNATTTATTLQLNNLDANKTYYWSVLANDNNANSSKSSAFQFLMARDSNPAVNSWVWNNTINISSTNTTPFVAENKTLSFKINASDPDNNPINFTWLIDNAEKSNAQNFTFNLANNFTAAGNYALKLTVTDNNSNSVSQEWQVTATNTNREPVLDAIASREAVEDSTLTFNITASDPDNDSLTFSSNISTMIFAKSANNSLATVSWVPTNDYVGGNAIAFTISDGTKTDSKTAAITVNNTNDAPTITLKSPAENKTIAEFAGIQRFNVTFLDVDAGDKTNATWFRNGTLIASNSTNVTVTNLTKGIYNIAVVINDTSLIARYEWKLTVTTDIFGDGLTSPVLKLNETQRQNAANVTINQTTFGGIDFGNNTLNLSGIAVLDDAFNISRGIISADTDKFPGLNKSASLAMKSLNYTKAPLIYTSPGFEDISNGAVCPDTICTNITYDAVNGILRFNVLRFSTYYTQTNATNGAPIITSTAVTQATERAKYTYDVEAADPDGDILVYSLITSPSGMGISNNTGLISWTPSKSQLGLNNVTVSASDGNITSNQSFQITVGKGPMLLISNLDVKVDGKTSKNIQNNTKISKKAKPGSKVEFKLEIENLFTREEDLKIENIDAEITIEDIDDGDNLDGDANEFDLKAGRRKDIKMDFDIPLEVDEDTYDVTIDAEGKDENGTTRQINYNLELEVEKENHEIRIIKAALAPSTIQCQRQISLDTEIMNTGAKDEDAVSIEAVSPELGINSVEKGIILDEGAEDNTFVKLIKQPISPDVLPGTYPITINAYYDDKLSGTKTVGLVVQECELTKQAKQEVKEEKPNVEVIKPAVIKEQKPAAPVKVSFAQTDEYELLLTILITLFIGTAVFIIGAAFIILKK